MDYRKIIKFGKNSHVISIPKIWLDKNKLNKGDLVYLNENDEGLIVSPKEKKLSREKKAIVINVDNKESEEIFRRITAHYIKSFDIIELIGKKLKDKTEGIKKHIKNLMALEIVEQTPSKIVAKDFLDMREISARDIIKKIDLIIRTMIIDSKETVDEDKYEEIYDRDEDVNRLIFLLYRIIRNASENPHMAKEVHLNYKSLPDFLKFSVYLETIADEAKRMARYARNLRIAEPARYEIKSLYSEIEECYKQTMRAYYNEDEKLAYLQANFKKQLIKKCNEFKLKYWKIDGIVSMIEKLKNMISAIHEMGRITYQ